MNGDGHFDQPARRRLRYRRKEKLEAGGKRVSRFLVQVRVVLLASVGEPARTDASQGEKHSSLPGDPLRQALGSSAFSLPMSAFTNAFRLGRCHTVSFGSF